MKILHIIPDLHGGGAQKFCMDLCNELAKEHDVTVCSLFDVEEHMFMAQALNPNIKLITLHKKLGLDASIFIKLYHLIRNENYEVINTHMRAIFYSAVAIIFNLPNTFHTVHNMADKETGTVSRFLHRILFRYFNVTPIGISREVLRSIQVEYGNKYTALIDNGVKKAETTQELSNVRNEIASYKKTADTKVFLTIGRIAHQKNYAMLVEVFNRLLSEADDVILLIIGDDPLPGKPTLIQLQAISKPEIHFLGMKQNVYDYLHCCDAFCLSSLYEGLPITLLESMSLGVIPICTPAGGIVDVIHDGKNGLLSTDLSGESYYAKIKQFLSLTDEEKITLSNNTMKDFEDSYDIATTAKKYLALYKGINE
jgi:glycosyltransferase involved in cell wall biosynthesis